MSDPVITTKAAGKEKVEDLVKVALKEAMEKRRMAASTTTTVVDSVGTVETFPITVTRIPKHSDLLLKDAQKFVSDVLGIPSPINDFPVTCFHDYAWDERIASFIPEIDPAYVIPADLAISILMAWELNEKVLCYGPTGAGKSSLIEQLCALTYRPFIRVNCTGDMDSSMIFGQLTAKDGSTHWVDGAVTEAVKYGAVFAWDEWDVTPPRFLWACSGF